MQAGVKKRDWTDVFSGCGENLDAVIPARHRFPSGLPDKADEMFSMVL